MASDSNSDSNLEQWITTPLTSIVVPLFEDWKQHRSTPLAPNLNLHEKFQQVFTSEEQLAKIPSLNLIPHEKLRNNCLVRFRCMVQDIFDSEYYMGIYDQKLSDPTSSLHHQNINNPSPSISCGSFRDIADVRDGYEINFYSSENVTFERTPLFCISAPGETNWSQQIFQSSASPLPSVFVQSTANSPSASGSDNTPSRKRDLEVDSMEVDSDPKKNKDEETEKPPASSSFSSFSISSAKHHPAHEDNGIACLVKVYLQEHDLKLNDIVEFFGVLTRETQAPLDGDEDNFGQTVISFTVPRIHTFYHRKLSSMNPLLPPFSQIQLPYLMDTSHGNFKLLRERVVHHLASFLLGDQLAAEYLLFNFLSTIFLRQSVTPYGRLAINISELNSQQEIVHPLVSMVKELVPLCYSLPMTLENLNTSRFHPVKNYVTNRLEAGTLQLPERTILILNETCLQAGQLKERGVKNIQALQSVLSHQQLEYDFQYHRLEFPTNLCVIILSDGTSLLPVDCVIPLKPNANNNNIAVPTTQEFLNECRMYIGLCAQSEYTINPAVGEFIEKQFAEQRQQSHATGGKKMTADDLHVQMNIARLLTLSHGEKTLSLGRWEQTQSLERQRQQRIQEMKSRNNVTNAPTPPATATDRKSVV